jgi:hypothetical protein
MTKWKAEKPELSTGWLRVVNDVTDEIDKFELCVCYGRNAEQCAELIAKALNALEAQADK